MHESTRFTVFLIYVLPKRASALRCKTKRTSLSIFNQLWIVTMSAVNEQWALFLHLHADVYCQQMSAGYIWITHTHTHTIVMRVVN